MEAMQKEVDDQMSNSNYKLMLKSEVPEGEKILPAV